MMLDQQDASKRDKKPDSENSEFKQNENLIQKTRNQDT